MNSVRAAWVGVLLMTVVTALTGCVTESIGGLPEPGTDAERVQAQLDLARGYMDNGELDRARGPLNKALQIDPRAVEPNVLLGVLNDTEGEYELAERYFKTALRIAPRNSQALNNYGSFLYGRGRYDEAVEHLRLLVQDTDYRARSQAYENLGLAELRSGNAAAAKTSFSRALQLNYAQPRASLELADISYREGDYLAAREYYDSFRSLARPTARSLCLGMQLAQVSGDTDQMASYALALNNLYPNSTEARECAVPK